MHCVGCRICLQNLHCQHRHWLTSNEPTIDRYSTVTLPVHRHSVFHSTTPTKLWYFLTKALRSLTGNLASVNAGKNRTWASHICNETVIQAASQCGTVQFFFVISFFLTPSRPTMMPWIPKKISQLQFLVCISFPYMHHTSTTSSLVRATAAAARLKSTCMIDAQPFRLKRYVHLT